MSKVIESSEMHHFVDDRNLSYSSNSLKKIDRYINHDLKLIFHWLRAKRVSLNVDKNWNFDSYFDQGTKWTKSSSSG